MTDKQTEEFVLKVSRLIDAVERLEANFVTKEGLEIALNTRLKSLEKQSDLNTIKSEWALRFTIGTLATISLTVLGAIMKMVLSAPNITI